MALGLGNVFGMRQGKRLSSWVQPGAIADLDFFNQRSFPQAFASELADTRTATQYVPNVSGILTPFGSGVLPISSSYMLVEPARTNIFLSSSDQTNATYMTQAGTASASNGANAGLTFTTFTENTSSSTHGYVGASGTNRPSLTAATAYTMSCYFFAGTRRYVLFSIAVSTNGISVVVDTTNGTIANAGLVGSGLVYTSSSAKLYPNGLIFVSITGSYTAGGAVTPLLRGSDVATLSLGPTYTGTSATILSSSPQIELGATATSPILTTTASATRDTNAITLQRTGVGRVVFTFDDDSQQTVSGINTGVQYTIPTNLNRPLIKRMTEYAV